MKIPTLHTLEILYNYTFQVVCLGQTDAKLWLGSEKVPSAVIDEYKKDVCIGMDDIVTSQSGQLHVLHTFQLTSKHTNTPKTAIEGNDL